jgi:hypothetical protein
MAGEEAMKKDRTDPELQRQIEAAATTGQPVGAVYTLEGDPAVLPAPEEVQARVARLLDKVHAQTGQKPGDVQVFGNIGSFAVSGPAEFVERLAQQPEVVTATASQPAEDVLIRPVRRRRVAGPRRGGVKKSPRAGGDKTRNS